ncbi:MAG: bifunctional diaminohydroxyphosphoribosylaminopyrimidine deaminase/5-amino-6-(5-phosphoribosylamino)uracil reductase RibD [Candidatus Omnitrophota bacterium]
MLTAQTKKDIYFLKKTFPLARKGEGFTSPNPLVGAILVKHKRIISCGYHRQAGKLHAEIKAIKAAKESLNGATLYINLEPCCHFGQTPPCVDEIIKSGIKKVVISVTDPNPKVSGKSITELRKAGVEVVLGLCKDEACRLNEVFFKNMKENEPFVVAKVAQSLDGKIATQKGVSQWITSSASRKLSKSLRDKYDCVLVGANTFNKDNPHLDGSRRIPYKVVVSARLNLALNSYILQKTPEKLIIFTSDKNKSKKRKFPRSVKVFFLKEDKGVLPVRKILKILYSFKIMSVFIEGGPYTLGQFFQEKAVDKAFFFIAPKVIGGSRALGSVGAEGFVNPKVSPYLENLKLKRINKDILIWGYPRYKPGK